MGPINWIAVAVAWVAAGAVAWAMAWAIAGVRGAALRSGASIRETRAWPHILAALLLLVSVTMVGHMFARVGPVTLAGKPWLYFMMSGGLALMFIAPAILISALRRAEPLRPAFYEAGLIVVTYLAIGAVFLLLD